MIQRSMPRSISKALRECLSVPIATSMIIFPPNLPCGVGRKDYLRQCSVSMLEKNVLKKSNYSGAENLISKHQIKRYALNGLKRFM